MAWRVSCPISHLAFPIDIVVQIHQRSDSLIATRQIDTLVSHGAYKTADRDVLRSRQGSKGQQGTHRHDTLERVTDIISSGRCASIVPPRTQHGRRCHSVSTSVSTAPVFTETWACTSPLFGMQLQTHKSQLKLTFCSLQFHQPRYLVVSSAPNHESRRQRIRHRLLHAPRRIPPLVQRRRQSPVRFSSRAKVQGRARTSETG